MILSPQPVVGQLKKFADDSSIKAIILHVNSPGGGVAASEEIYREVKRIREEKKKRIVVSIETVGASGAYYIASASNKIYADQGSIVGSIGVIAEWVNYGDLLKWAKLKNVVFKTGEFKDTGNPARDLTPAEQAYMQSLIDNMFGQFVQAVADGRGMKFDDVKAIANGKVWTGKEALSMKLIDDIGDFEAVVNDTAKSVGISGEPTLVHPEKDRRDAARSDDGRRLAVPSRHHENAGAARGVLLSVEVAQFRILNKEPDQMGVGHVAVALGAAKVAPRLNVGWLVFAALLSDFLLGIFAFAGLEHASVPADYAARHYLLFTFPYSHGLLCLVLWAAIAGFLNLLAA